MRFVTVLVSLIDKPPIASAHIQRSAIGGLVALSRAESVDMTQRRPAIIHQFRDIVKERNVNGRVICLSFVLITGRSSLKGFAPT